jgi:hypothetical protein
VVTAGRESKRTILHCGQVSNTFSGGWLAGAGLGVLAGTALQLLQAELSQPAAHGVAALAGAVGLAVLAWRRLQGGRALALALLAAGLLAWGATGWRAELRLADALDASLDGRDIDDVRRAEANPLWQNCWAVPRRAARPAQHRRKLDTQQQGLQHFRETSLARSIHTDVANRPHAVGVDKRVCLEFRHGILPRKQ